MAQRENLITRIIGPRGTPDSGSKPSRYPRRDHPRNRGIGKTPRHRVIAESAGEAVKLSGVSRSPGDRLGTSQDRVKAFQAAARQASTDQREQQKSAAIAAWERKFANKVTAGARLDKAIAELSAAVAQYHTVSAEVAPVAGRSLPTDEHLPALPRFLGPVRFGKNSLCARNVRLGNLQDVDRAARETERCRL